MSVDIHPTRDVAEVHLATGYESESIELDAESLRFWGEQLLAAAQELETRAGGRSPMTNYNPDRHRTPLMVWTDRNDPGGRHRLQMAFASHWIEAMRKQLNRRTWYDVDA